MFAKYQVEANSINICVVDRHLFLEPFTRNTIL